MNDIKRYKNEIEIIKKAQEILKDSHAFRNSTTRIQLSVLKHLNNDDYKKLDYKLKAIRQDYTKLLVIMNRIEMTYLDYQNNKYKISYYSIIDNQATSELGCLIEYLFAKYRVILEYIQQILEICIPSRLTNDQRKVYASLKKYYKKFDFLLKVTSENIDNSSDLLNMEWFQQLRVDRDLIIHDGATCLVFGDKENLIFRVMTTDAMDSEEQVNYNSFYCNKKGLINYKRYWGLYISNLIIFSEIIFEFLLIDSELEENQQFILNQMGSSKDELIDSNGTILPTIQSVLEDLLRSVIESQ